MIRRLLVFLGALIFSSLILLKSIRAQSSWETKLNEILQKDPALQKEKISLQIIETQLQQSFFSWTPDLKIYHAQIANQDIKPFSQAELGLTAELNLFSFGRDYKLYKSRQAGVQAQKIQLETISLSKENQYLGVLLKNVLLKKKLEYFKEILDLKRKTLALAQLRYNRGNLPRQQIEKVSIDLNNFESQRLSLEKELAESELSLKQLALDGLDKNWPWMKLKSTDPAKFGRGLVSSGGQKKKESSSDFNYENSELKLLKYENDQARLFLNSVKSQFWPSLDLTGKYYRFPENSHLGNQWDLGLVLTWKLWDKQAHHLLYLDALKTQVFLEGQLARRRLIQEDEFIFYQHQLVLSQSKLNKSFQGLNKLNDLYGDTEKLFSQGRITVNELFQDQQLLLETKINFENDVLDFHQSLINFCAQNSLRVWQCL